MSTPDEAAALAELFHETYERLAPSFGYETRDETKQFDPKSANGRLMIAVCSEVLTALTTTRDRLLAERRDVAVAVGKERERCAGMAGQSAGFWAKEAKAAASNPTRYAVAMHTVRQFEAFAKAIREGSHEHD